MKEIYRVRYRVGKERSCEIIATEKICQKKIAEFLSSDMERILSFQKWSQRVTIQTERRMFNFIITVIFASAMFILGDAVGINGLIEICNKIVSVFH